MAVSAAPACKALLAEATRLWPNRSRASDGILPSAAHTIRNPTSDHELGNAVDLTHDPKNGCDAHALAETLRVRRDARINYVISNRRIWTPAISSQWRPYNGSNPHTTHMHVSIHATARNSTGLWFPLAATRPPTPPQFRRTNSFEVATVPINTYDVPITTDGNGCGWHKVAIPRDRILGYTAPGIRPEADGRYVTAEVGFAGEDGGTVISVTEWEPNSCAVVGISVVN